MQLKLRTKIILLPALAGVTGLAMLATSLVFAKRSQHELATLEQGHYAALDASRAAESDLQHLSRILQDAVAAANVLAPAFARGVPAARDLARIQKRRMWPTRLTQRAQVLIQDKILSRALGARGPARLPWQLRLLKRLPYLRRFPARFVGMGARPEHVHTRVA